MNTFSLIRLSIVTGLISVTFGILFNNPLNLCIGFILFTLSTLFHIKILESLHSDLLPLDSN